MWMKRKAPGATRPCGQRRGRGLDDLRQPLVEGEVVGLEGGAGQRPAVGHVHLGGVLVVRGVGVEEVADREGLPRLEVRADDDRAAPQVGAHLHEVPGAASLLLPAEEPVEEVTVLVPEPPGYVVEHPRFSRQLLVGTECGVGHEAAPNTVRTTIGHDLRTRGGRCGPATVRAVRVRVPWAVRADGRDPV